MLKQARADVIHVILGKSISTALVLLLVNVCLWPSVLSWFLFHVICCFFSFSYRSEGISSVVRLFFPSSFFCRFGMFFFIRVPRSPNVRPLHNTRVTPQSSSPTTTRSRVQVVHCNASVATNRLRSMTPREESGSEQGRIGPSKRYNEGTEMPKASSLWRRAPLPF